jgi:hypothetical protein
MNNCSRWQYWLRRLLHNRTQQRDRDGDHVLGVPSRFATMLIAGAAGVAALLLTYPYIAASIKWAGFAYLLFIAWQLAQPHPHATRKDLNPAGFKPLSFWLAALLRQSESMDARWGHGRIVHGEQCGRRQYRNYCDCVFDRCHRFFRQGLTE